MREPDALFADPRQAALYDHFDDDRSDLAAYVAIVRESRARRVIDIGCGTGSLAVRLAAEGLEVVGVDPARASLDVARDKPHAARVDWVHGDATILVGRFPAADLAVMTGNVAQVFVSDQDWSDTLSAVHTCLRPGGRLVFETRRPEVRAWEGWDVPPTTTRLPDGREAVVERTVTVVPPPWPVRDGDHHPGRAAGVGEHLAEPVPVTLHEPIRLRGPLDDPLAVTAPQDARGSVPNMTLNHVRRGSGSPLLLSKGRRLVGVSPEVAMGAGGLDEVRRGERLVQPARADSLPAHELDA